MIDVNCGIWTFADKNRWRRISRRGDAPGGRHGDGRGRRGDHLHRLRSMKVPLQLGDNWR